MNLKIFDSLLEPIFVINEREEILYCNEPAALLTGQSARKLKNNILSETLTFSTAVEALNRLSSVNESTPYQELSFQNTDGISGRGQLTIQKIQVDHLAHPAWLVFLRDVTLEERLQRKYRSELEQKESYIEDLKRAKAELENYSKNLEKMVQERTHELSRLNYLLGALLDSLGQGFFVFDSTGLCLEISTKACSRVLETQPPGQWVWDVLKIEKNKVDGFKKWMTTAFAEMLPFEDLAPLAPSLFAHSQGLHIDLNYFPLRTNEKIDGIVVVATDSTDLVSARQEAQKEKSHAELILKLMHNKKNLMTFLKEAEILQHSLSVAINKDPIDWEVVNRALHTLKGGAATFSLVHIAQTCHLAEDEARKENRQLVQKMQHQLTQQFSDFFNEYEVIIGSRNNINHPSKEISVVSLIHFYQNHIHNAKERHQFLESFLMSPAQESMQIYDQLIQSTAESIGKKIHPLKVINGQLPIYAPPYRALFSSLAHAFRNAVDHGIEAPEVRTQKNKAEYGMIQVIFERSPAHLKIVIKDDGQGIDPTKIRTQLQSQGVNINSLSDNEVLQYIFKPNFSTKSEVTTISGRGVGLDAVMSAVQDLGGKAWVTSKVDQGAELHIEVPYFQELNKQPIKAA